jgi:hypothetical protein
MLVQKTTRCGRDAISRSKAKGTAVSRLHHRMSVSRRHCLAEHAFSVLSAGADPSSARTAIPILYLSDSSSRRSVLSEDVALLPTLAIKSHRRCCGTAQTLAHVTRRSQLALIEGCLRQSVWLRLFVSLIGSAAGLTTRLSSVSTRATIRLSSLLIMAQSTLH